MKRSFYITSLYILLCIFSSFLFAAEITIDTAQITNPSIGGFGFQMDYHYWKEYNRKKGINEDVFKNVIVKRWRELRPGFARTALFISDWEPNEGVKTWDSDGMKAMIKNLELLKSTDTEVYLTTWMGSCPKWLKSGHLLTEPGMQQKFVKTHVDLLEYLVREKGFTNIHYYCISNEMTTTEGWGKFSEHLDVYKQYNQKLYDELKKRNLGEQIKILVNDEAAVKKIPNPKTLDWVMENMDDIAGVYGIHCWEMVTDLKEWTAKARAKNKNFIIGEFGNHEGTWKCPWRESPKYGIDLSKYAVDALNAGTYAMSNWIFMDEYWHNNRLMEFGVFTDAKTGFKIKPAYYSYGMMCKYFRPNSKAFEVNSNDLNTKAGAAMNNEKGSYSIVIINSNKKAQEIVCKILNEQQSFLLERHLFDPSKVPTGDSLPAADKTVEVTEGKFNDIIPAGGMAVYSNHFSKER